MQTRSKTQNPSATGFGSLQTSNVVLVVDKIETLYPISYEQDENGLYEVNIDFDDASKAWRANKKSIGNGQYVYIREKKSK